MTAHGKLETGRRPGSGWFQGPEISEIREWAFPMGNAANGPISHVISRIVRTVMDTCVLVWALRSPNGASNFLIKAALGNPAADRLALR